MKAKMYKYQVWVDEVHPLLLKNKVSVLLNSLQFDSLGFIEHHFTPFGYTCIWLLGESHLAIHTFPEEQKSYIDLTSCEKNKFNKFINNFPFKVLSNSR